MLAIRTILHPTDFSERSLPAFRLACALAHDYTCRLILLHVMERPIIAPLLGAVPPDPENLQQEVADKLERLASEPKGVAIEHRLATSDNAASEIVRVAKETGSDLIVLGTHGRTGLVRMLMGSVAEQVSRKASCPVLTVKMPFPSEAAAQEHRSRVASQASELMLF
jgi:nucleotide-binding universal stress UspA family protein